MKIAIMQPYFLPYIGYFQLLNVVDKFVIYDDVNFIKKGWINRNNILVNKTSFLFTIPIVNASQNKKINELILIENTEWKDKLMRTFELNYKKAPNYLNVYPLLRQLIYFNGYKLSDFILNSIIVIKNYLDINTEIIESSSIYDNKHLKGQERIKDICLNEFANEYINPIGGKDIYSREFFLKEGISLKFIELIPFEYKQFEHEFIPYLSIIDVLMFNSKENIQLYLNKFKIL